MSTEMAALAMDIAELTLPCELEDCDNVADWMLITTHINDRGVAHSTAVCSPCRENELQVEASEHILVCAYCPGNAMISWRWEKI